MDLVILILKIISGVFCILSAVSAAHFYFKVKRLLSDNSDEVLDSVMPEIESYLKKLSYSLYFLCGVILISLVSTVLSYFFR